MRTPISSPHDLEREYPELVRELRATAILEERRRLQTEHEASAAGVALMEQAAERANAAKRVRTR